MPVWKRNLYVVCAAQLLTLIGFSSYLSFIPYYIQSFTTVTDQEALNWTAAIQTAGMLAMMVAAPIWGSLADRYGRKLMMVRATGAAVVLVLLMGLVRSPEQLIVLRVLSGIFCGTVGAANTLVAAGTPEEAMGRSLGLLQMTTFLANAVGPLIGGVAADILGYRAVFPGASALMAVALLGIVFMVQEKRDSMVRTAQRVARPRIRLSRQSLARLASSNALYLIAAMTGASFAGSVLSPVLPMYIKVLAPGTERLATLAGSLTSVMAVTAAISAVGIGAIGDRFGQRTTLLVSMLGVAVLALPQAFVTTATQLMVLRALHGVFVGGMMPTANALLARSTPPERRGTVLGLASGGSAGGMALGPTVGAAVAGRWGLSSTFFVTSGVFAVLSALVFGFVRLPPREVATARRCAVLAGPAESERT